MNELMEFLGLMRPEAQRMADEAGVIGDRHLRAKPPDLFRDAWSDLYGVEEPFSLLDREDRRTLFVGVVRMLGKREKRQ